MCKPMSEEAITKLLLTLKPVSMATDVAKRKSPCGKTRK